MKFIPLTLQSAPTVTVFVNAQNIASFSWDATSVFSVVVCNFPDSGTGTAHTISVNETPDQIMAKIHA